MSTVPAPPATFYVCPGERHAISRSVHWGRLAAGYEKCRTCEHRHDIGLVARRVLIEPHHAPASHALEFSTDGLRGRYLNDLDRARAATWAAALASFLWDQRPLIGRLADDAASLHERRELQGPTVVVGFDERPTSPDLAAGVVTALRQMGCRTIDIGLATKPVWLFAVRQEFDNGSPGIAIPGSEISNGGIFVTGAGREPAWTGLDFVGATPEELSSRVDPPPVRPTRTAGRVESRAVFDDYTATLSGHFHALRPLKVVCATPLNMLQFLLPCVFAALPCELTCLPWPRQRRTDLPAGSERLTSAVCDRAADLGFLIDEDGQTCDLWNERGEFVSADVWQSWLAGALPDAMDFADGVVTLGLLLQALSLSDAALSERLASQSRLIVNP